MRSRSVVIAAVAALVAIGVTQAAFGAGQTYVERGRAIKAGVLVLTGAGGTISPVAPYIFFIMGQREDVKPNGWTFVNPIPLPDLGQGFLSPNAKRYWMVPLEQTTLENLSKFDLLYMSARQDVLLAMAERDKLRRFVDGGGCLWVDDAGGMGFWEDPAYAFFLPGVGFSGPVTPSGPPSILARLHPLVTNPFWLDPAEVASLDVPAGGGMYTINPGYTGTFGGVLPSPTILAPVVVIPTGTSFAPTVAAIEYGSGRVVFTSGFVGGKIECPVTGCWPPAADPPDFLTAGNSNLLAAAPANLRFAYNVVGWAASYTTHRKNLRRTGASLESVGAPLVNKWRLLGAPPPASGGSRSIESSPAIWKNVIFYSDDKTLYALDAVPEEDLDGDGNLNDGDQATTTGSNADVIWKASVNQDISSPTVATMLDPRSGTLVPRDFVLVMGADGRVHVFDAFPQAADGRLSGTPVERTELWGVQPSNGNSSLLPPVVQNGWIYASGLDGKIYAYSPVLAAAGSHGVGAPGATWTIPLVFSPSGTAAAKIKYGPTFGFIKNQANGAVVQMLCVVAERNDGTIVTNDSVYTLPVFVSSDRLTPVNVNDLINPAGATISFRTSYPQVPVSSYPAPIAWAINPNGQPVVATYDSNPLPGIVNIHLGAGLGPNTRVYLTYAPDYSVVGPTGIYVPPSYQIPPQIGDIVNGIIKLEPGATPALGPNDAFYMGVKWPDATSGSGNAAVYSMWFDGAASKLKWPYFLHGGGSIPDPTVAPGGGTIANPVTIRGAVNAREPVNQTLVPVRGLQVNTTPAVTTDKVFVTATTVDPGTRGLSHSYLLCFKADPDFVIRVRRPMRDLTNGRQLSVRIWQPCLLFDPLASTMPPVNAAKSVPRNMIDYDTGTITITDFTWIRMTGSPDGSRSIDTITLTPSLPVWVFLDNTVVPPDEVDLSSWDNLVWSLALPYHDQNGNGQYEAGEECSGVSSSPVVLGDYVYFTCNDGYMYAVSVDASPPDKTDRILDPMAADVDSWMPMRHRIEPDTSMNVGSSARVTIGAAGGTLAVPCAAGLYAFSDTLYLVTDNHRVLEIGGDGKVAWACDSVSGSNPMPLNKPLVAQKFSASDYLVVDSGNDQVIRMDRGGQVTWSLKDFDDPKNLLRSGEPRTLKNPSDARVWGEFEKSGTDWFYVSHCLIADTGNFRVLDVTDTYEATDDGQIKTKLADRNLDGRPDYHELNWVSSTTYKDKRFAFNSVQLIRGSGNLGGTQVEVNQIWASVGNYGLGTAATPDLPESTGGGQLGGAILSMKYREQSGPFQWNYLTDAEVTGQLTSLNDGGTRVALSGPTYFAVLDSTLPRLLICDSSAVYVTEGPTGNITWKLTGDDYAALSRTVTNSTNNQPLGNQHIPIPFSPQRAQMLPNGRLLIVNSYAGQVRDDLRNKFVGEVFEVDDKKTQIYWYAPEMWFDPDTGVLVQKMPNAPNLDQPTCAQKLF